MEYAFYYARSASRLLRCARGQSIPYMTNQKQKCTKISCMTTRVVSFFSCSSKMLGKLQVSRFCIACNVTTSNQLLIGCCLNNYPPFLDGSSAESVSVLFGLHCKRYLLEYWFFVFVECLHWSHC